MNKYPSIKFWETAIPFIFAGVLIK